MKSRRFPIYRTLTAALVAVGLSIASEVDAAYTARVFQEGRDASKQVETEVGSVTITFTDGNHATFAYTVNGVAQSKAITRQVFAAPGTVCY